MRKVLLLMTAQLLFVIALWAQKTVTGRVTDDQGQPLANVSVQVKGTSVGTVTGANGNYSLLVSGSNATLVFSFVDNETQEVKISDGSTYNVSMKPVSGQLGEVVVTAYGTIKKEAFTGSVGTIKAADIEKRPLGNITRSIEGNIAGVVTTTGSGQPGAGTSIRVRGFGSFAATQEPLLIVDGIPYSGGSSNINPDDVESITVLKDASATALYGSRAGNGVVMITTKKGKKGRNNISVRIAQGTSSRGLEEYERANAFDYYPLMWEAYRNSLVYPASGTGISFDSASRVASGLTNRTHIADLLAYNPFNVSRNSIVGVDGKINPGAQLIYEDDLDWNKDLMRNGVRKDYGINFSGGADKSDYFFSVGYLQENGYTVKTDFERYSARLNLNLQPLNWLKAGLNLSGNNSLSNSANEDGAIANPFSFSRNMGPIYPYYAHNMTTGAYVLDASGNKVWDLGNFGNSPIGIANGIPNRVNTTAGRHSPAEIILNEDIFRRWVVSARQNTEITFLRDFKFTNNIAIDYQSHATQGYENQLVGDGAPGGRSERIVDLDIGFTANQLLSYGHKFNDHKIDALVGHESFNFYRTNLRGFKQGQSLTGNTELGNFTTVNALASSLDRYRIESYLSRVNYDFRGKYLLSASLRRDGNSRFSPQSRWGTFWSVGAGWNISKEDFMSGISFVNNLKLRGSYGHVGVADDIGFYAWQGLYGFANNANEPGIVQSQTSFENKELTWEINTQLDIGVEFSLFKNRVSGSFEYYKRESADLLFDVPQPLSSGALTVTKNTATLANKGIEAQVSVDIIKTKNFTWNTNIIATTVSNNISKMPEGSTEIIDGTKKYQVGASRYDYWLRTYYGVDPTDGSALYLAQNTTATSGIRLIQNKGGGFDTTTTLVANGKFEYNGSVIPDVYGSFTQSLRFKDFTLSALFTFQVGGKTFDALYQDLMRSGAYGFAVHQDILGRWQKPGDITNIPRMDNGRTTDHNATSSRWLIDASYFNIRSMNVAYQLPQTLLSKVRINSAQVFVSAENIAFISKRKGMNNQNAFSGITSNAYPPARVITTGITFNL